MKPFIRKLIFWCWPFLLLGGYLTYRAIAQYSRIPSSFSSFNEARQFAWRLKFPSIGLGFRGGTSDRQGEVVCVYAVELLFRQKDRVFVVAGTERDFKVVDEFISGRTIDAVQLKLGKLQYLDSNKQVIFERDVR